MTHSVASSPTTLRIKSTNQGFTLIEMILALTIFAMLAMATYTVLNNTISSKEQIDSASAQLRDLQRAMMMIEGDFSQIVQRKIRINGEQPSDDYFRAEQYLLDSEELGIGFVRDGWTNPAMILPRSELQAVGYRVVEGGLERLYTNYVDADMNTEPRVQPLLKGVSKIEVRYWDDNEWQEEQPDDALPSLIKIILFTDSYGEIERVFPMIEKTHKVTKP